jgi:hypothetical protein
VAAPPVVAAAWGKAAAWVVAMSPALSSALHGRAAVGHPLPSQNPSAAFLRAIALSLQRP